MTYHIRQYQQSDIEKVLEIFRLNTPAYFDPSEESGLIKYLEAKGNYFYVAVKESGIIGGGGHDLPINQTHAMLSWYFVHPNVYGQGIGTALVRQNWESVSMKTHINKLIVRTSQFAYPFFEKHGFETIEVKIDYWAKGYDLYFMQMDLCPYQDLSP